MSKAPKPTKSNYVGFILLLLLVVVAVLGFCDHVPGGTR